MTSSASRSRLHLRQLGRDIRAGTAVPLAAAEFEEILSTLEAPATSYEIRRHLLKLALIDRRSHNGLAQYCSNVMEKVAMIPGFSGYEAASDLALQYLLATAPEKEYWVRQFEQSRFAVLRLAVAEHVFGTDPHRALIAMIETIPLAGTDNAITDAIDLWLSNESTAQLLAVVDARLADLAITQPNSALTAAFRHAYGIIAGECS